MDQISIMLTIRIQVIPCDVDQYYSVIKFDLTGCQVSILPVELFNLNLKILDLRENIINIIPKEIKNLTNLERLHIGHNKLSKLPKEIKNLTNLERLCIGNNKLSKLPKELFSLKNCTHLVLNGNIYMDTYGPRKERFEELERNGFIDY